MQHFFLLNQVILLPVVGAIQLVKPLSEFFDLLFIFFFQIL